MNVFFIFWLVSSALFADHALARIKQIFGAKPMKVVLEFGIGQSTNFFLDSCNKVFSIEFITHGHGPEGFKQHLESYHDYSNWIPIAYFSGYQSNTNWATYKYLGSQNVYKADSYQCATHQSYAALDDFYLKELDSFLTSLLKSNRIDFALVNPDGFYLRSDLVQLLFDKVSIIVATAFKYPAETGNIYGYDRLKVPEQYEQIYFADGQEIGVWVRKDEEALIQALRSA